MMEGLSRVAIFVVLATPSMFSRDWGILPQELLCARFKYWRWRSSLSWAGIYPENMLDLRRRYFSSGNFCPIHVGILPKNLFCPRSRKVSSGQFCINRGNSSERLLLSILRVSIDIDSGMVELESLSGEVVLGVTIAELDVTCSEHRGKWPVIILFPMSRYLRDCTWHNDAGIVPVK